MKITRLNYFSEFEKHKHLDFTKSFLDTHKLLETMTQNGNSWNRVSSKQTYIDLSENQFFILGQLIQARKSVTKTAQSDKPKTKNATAPKSKQPAKTKQVADKPSKAAKPERKVFKIMDGSPVETVDPHIIILKSYLGLNKKPVTRDKVMALARRLVKQIEARTLRKASAYAPLIENMRENLFDRLTNTKGAMIQVGIAEKQVQQIEKAIAEQAQMKSVQLLRRYASISGRTTTIDKAKKLYNDMHKAIEKEQIPEDDRYFERVITVMKKLLAYVEHENETKVLELLPAELSGVLGCPCKKKEKSLNGISINDLESDQQQESLEELDDEKDDFKPIASTDFMKMTFVRYAITGKWRDVFGEIEPGKHTIVFSKEKLGKTTLLVDFAGYLARTFGPVLFIQKEEELSGTFQEKFKLTQAATTNLQLETKLPHDINRLRAFKFVFLDSVSRLNLSPKQINELQKAIAPDTTLIAILHSTKDGNYKGATDYVHDASQIVEFTEMGKAFGRGRFIGCTGQVVNLLE